MKRGKWRHAGRAAIRSTDWTPLHNLGIATCLGAGVASFDPDAALRGLGGGAALAVGYSAATNWRALRDFATTWRRQIKRHGEEGRKLPALKATLSVLNPSEMARAEVRFNGWMTELGFQPPPKLIGFQPTKMGETYTARCRGGNADTTRVMAVADKMRRDIVGKPCFDLGIYPAPDGGAVVTFDVQRVDIASRRLGNHPIIGTPPGWSIMDRALVGRDDNDDPVLMPFYENSILVGGQPRTGKSTLLNTIVEHAVGAVDALLVLIDMKGGLEGAFFEPACWLYAETGSGARDVMEQIKAVREQRWKLLRGNARKITVSPEWPLVVVVCDEIAELPDDVLEMFREEMGLGGATGIFVAGATQDPTVDLIPSRVRSKFKMHAAFKTRSATESNVIMGPGMAALGVDASRLPANGVCWMDGIGSGAGTRVRTYQLTEEQVTVMVETARPMKEALHEAVRSAPWNCPASDGLDSDRSPSRGRVEVAHGDDPPEIVRSSGPSGEPAARQGGPERLSVVREPSSGTAGPGTATALAEPIVVESFAVPAECVGRSAWTEVWRALVGLPDGGRAGVIADLSNVSTSTVHEALKALTAAGRVRKDGLAYFAVPIVSARSRSGAEGAA